jgi:hypothetical protein
MEPRTAFNEAGCYQIRVKGLLDPGWADWFDGLTLAQVNGDSLLTGNVRDQAALHGLLNKIRDLGLYLLLVELVEDECNPMPKTE